MSTDAVMVPVEELAKKYMVSTSTVRGWLRMGYIPRDTYLKIGSTYRFDVAKVTEALMKVRSKEEENEVVVPMAPVVPVLEGPDVVADAAAISEVVDKDF